MRRYEAMFVLKSDLNEEERNNLFTNIGQTISRHNGGVVSSEIWQEKRKLSFPIKRQKEGLYYLVNFDLEPQNILRLNQAFKINEDILRVLITVKTQN